MDYIINHNRGQCESEYNKILNNVSNNVDKNINNKCILLSYRTDIIPQPDKTFNEKTWLENSADLLKLNYDVEMISTDPDTLPFTSKISSIYNLLLNYQSSFEYALYTDAFDSVVVNNPDNLVNVLKHYNCDIIFGTTTWYDHDYYTMNDRFEFNKNLYNIQRTELGLNNNNNILYLNAGTFGGKISSLIKLFDRVLDYASFDIPWKVHQKQYRRTNGYKTWDENQMKNFPKNVSDDQTIFRYLIKEFYPLIKIDIINLLAASRA